MAEGGVGHEENDFSPYFREYMERELYDSSRVYGPCEYPGWVFWDRRDGYPDLTLPNYHSLDFNPNLRIRLKIGGALRKLIEDPSVMHTLFQFWAPIKTVEGRTYLTVQNQPFAFGFGFCNSSDLFCQHRTRICNLLFDAHAECAEEQLGLPARVFLHKLPEAAPYPSYNTLDLASSHIIKATWALPVFEINYSACVGVLEIATCFPGYCESRDYLHRMCENFQEFGLSCLDEDKHRIMHWQDIDEAHIAAFKELEVACNSVCVIPEVSFASAWVSSRSRSDLLRGLFRLPYVHCDSLLKSPGILHMRKVHIIGSEVPISSLSCCWDIRGWNLSKVLFPIEAYTGCFTMCLRCSNTAELYVVQLFLSKLFCNPKNRLSKLRLMMDTMKGYFGTLRLAYGQEWREELPLAVIDYRKDQKNHHIEMIPATDPEFLTDGPVTLQPSLLDQASITLHQGYQPSVDSITNGSEAQNSNSPSLVSLPNGIEVLRGDSYDQKSHLVETISATGCIPSQRRPPSVDSVNNGMYVCTEPQNSYTLSDPSRDSLPNDSDPSRDSLPNDSDPSHNSLPNGSDPNHDSMPNGIEMMEVDLSDQASVDPSNSFEDQEQSMELNSDDRASAIGTLRNPGIQDANTVTVKAKVENYYTIKFSLSSTPRLVELQEEVAKRKIDPGAYDIFCTDEGEKPIGCDYDLQQLIDKSRSLGNTLITVMLRPKQPSPP